METVDQPLVDKCDGILNKIADRLAQSGSVDDRIQDLLGRLSSVLPYLPRLKSSAINDGQAELVVTALLAPSPEAVFAETVVKELERRVRIYRSPLRSNVYGRTPATFVLLGILVHGAILLVGLLGLTSVVHFPTGGSVLGWVPMTIAGAIGGATSLFMRLNDIASLSRWSAEGDPLQLFYTGLLKPFIGIVAGLFAYAAVSTGLVTIQVPGQAASPQVFYIALAFLAGFSERFAKDLTEGFSLPREEGTSGLKPKH